MTVTNTDTASCTLLSALTVQDVQDPSITDVNISEAQVSLSYSMELTGDYFKTGATVVLVAPAAPALKL